MQKLANYNFGVEAEGLVADKYKQNGYKILKSRYKTKHGELDLIAHKQGLIIFIEVKARKEKADEVITQHQIKRICRAALIFLSEFPEYSNCGIRFDLVTVDSTKQIRVIENAWEVSSDIY